MRGNCFGIEGKEKALSNVDAFKVENKLLKEVLWLQMGENEVKCSQELLNCCLVGRWADAEGFDPSLEAVKN